LAGGPVAGSNVVRLGTPSPALLPARPGTRLLGLSTLPPQPPVVGASPAQGVELRAELDPGRTVPELTRRTTGTGAATSTATLSARLSAPVDAPSIDRRRLQAIAQPRSVAQAAAPGQSPASGSSAARVVTPAPAGDHPMAAGLDALSQALSRHPTNRPGPTPTPTSTAAAAGGAANAAAFGAARSTGTASASAAVSPVSGNAAAAPRAAMTPPPPIPTGRSSALSDLLRRWPTEPPTASSGLAVDPATAWHDGATAAPMNSPFGASRPNWPSDASATAALLGPQLPLGDQCPAELPASDLAFSRSLERVLLAEVRRAGIEVDTP
jgi:hypothetical protein